MESYGQQVHNLCKQLQHVLGSAVTAQAGKLTAAYLINQPGMQADS
jgi:O-acetyl-ADP-ribose deacetylase (regulator of RNase III)